MCVCVEAHAWDMGCVGVMLSGLVDGVVWCGVLVCWIWNAFCVECSLWVGWCWGLHCVWRGRVCASDSGSGV